MLPEALTKPSDESPLIMLNQKYACIGDVGGKCMVMGWVPSKADPVVELPSFQTFKSFAERYGNQYVSVTKETKDGGHEEEPKQLGAYWLKWRRRRSYEGIDLVPGANGKPTNAVSPQAQATRSTRRIAIASTNSPPGTASCHQRSYFTTGSAATSSAPTSVIIHDT